MEYTGTTLHYFIAEHDVLDVHTLENALKTLGRHFGLKFQAATFEGRKGYTVSINMPGEAVGNVAQNISAQLQELLTLNATARPVFPGRYPALQGPSVRKGDTLLTFPHRRAANG